VELKETLLETCYRILANSTLFEMAVNRSKLDQLVQDQYRHIANHPVNHGKVVDGFHDMMRRCFAKMNSEQPITKEDIY
jgi:hypothetical protein